MASKAPIEGRCGSPLARRPGWFCEAKPLKGKTRCKHHGGKQQGERPHNMTHGRRSSGSRYARVSEAAQRAIDEAMQDPHLLDARHPVAVARVVLNDVPIVPDDDVVTEMARARNIRMLSGIEVKDSEVLEELVTPTRAQLDLARMAFGEKAMALIDKFGRRQTDSLKQIEVGRMMRDTVVPMFQEMGLRIGRLIGQYVPEEHQAAFRESFRQECRHVLAELMAAKGSG